MISNTFTNLSNPSRAFVTHTLAVGIFLLGASALSAQFISYDLTGYAGSTATGPIPDVATPTAVPAYMTASDITRGPGLAPAYLSQGFSANNFTNTSNHVPPMDATRDNAIVNGDFFQVSFGVASGSASFSTLDMIGRISSAITNWEWQYSLDGFATAGATLHAYDPADIPAGGAGGILPSIDLTGISALQNLAAGTELTLRLYGWGATGNGNTMAFGRSTQLSGEGGAYQGPALNVTVVPEPSTYAAIFGVVILGFACFRRKARAV